MGEQNMRGLVRMDDMQFGFMPGKGTTHALFILGRMQEECRGGEKKDVGLWTWKRHLIVYREK